MTSQVETIHLVFKTHLDLGFTDLARHVVAQYFDEYVPQAIETAAALRHGNRSERFVWTAGSWLIHEYLETASPPARRRLETAIKVGDITWHGLPFTTHSELMDASLFRFGLSLSQQLDRRYGKTTIAAKMTDVPGHTRGIVPLLAEAGIQFLHIGVNPASAMPAVLPLFVWRDQGGAEIIVMYQHSYGDLMLVPGLSQAIMVCHSADNLGPPTIDQILDAHDSLQRRFPLARIVASTLDAYAHCLAQIKHQLPVITQEIGDTWIHGVGTDPRKVAQFRELLRLRSKWLAQKRVAPDDLALARFSNYMLMVAEHTWGMDTKTHLADTSHYCPESLEQVRCSARFQSFAASWSEQREYVTQAIAALGPSALAAEARDRLKALDPAYPSADGFVQVPDLSQRFDTQHFSIGFDQATGAIAHLRDRCSGHHWADEAHLLGLVRYQTFSKADYDRFVEQYLNTSFDWALADFTKPGMEQATVESGWWQPALSQLLHKGDATGHHFLLIIEAPDRSDAPYGCPQRFSLELFLPRDEPVLRFTLQWFSKPATRLPEALWFSFCPMVPEPNRWLMQKLGQWISPLEVVAKGNRKLHAIEQRIAYNDGEYEVKIESLDTPLVAPGEPSLLNFDDRQPVLARGMHFNLYNNIWGTNFPLWYNGDASFRFELTLHPLKELDGCPKAA